MEVRIDEHAKQRALERGVTENEILDTLKHGESLLVKSNSLAKEKFIVLAKSGTAKFLGKNK